MQSATKAGAKTSTCWSPPQARIRDRVEAIIRRIESRAPVIRSDPRYQAILEELPQATKAMLEVERELGETEIEAALTDAQVALKHLQRADAVFRDINVSLSNRGQGSQQPGFRRPDEPVRAGDGQAPPPVRHGAARRRAPAASRGSDRRSAG